MRSRIFLLIAPGGWLFWAVGLARATIEKISGRARTASSDFFIVLTSRKTSYDVVGTRELLRTFRRLSDVGNRQEVAFSLCRKLVPASLLQLPILAGTLGDRTLAWRVGAHIAPRHFNTRRVPSRPRLSSARQSPKMAILEGDAFLLPLNA